MFEPCRLQATSLGSAASHCPTCQQPWKSVRDRSYVHGVKQGSQQAQQIQQARQAAYMQGWGNYSYGKYEHPQQPQQGDSSQRQRTQSPRQRQREENRHKAEDKLRSFHPCSSLSSVPAISTARTTFATSDITASPLDGTEPYMAPVPMMMPMGQMPAGMPGPTPQIPVMQMPAPSLPQEYSGPCFQGTLVLPEQTADRSS